MQSIRVALGERSYTIYAGPGVMTDSALLRASIRGGRAAIVTNTVVGPLYAGPVEQALAGLGIATLRITLADGEVHKTWDSLSVVYDAMLAARCDRQTSIVALGGGVVGDVAGFAAATFMRGVPFVQVPTTLLAQVDSSVGGKTGINRPRGKNMVGAFYQPAAVLADTEVLGSLPERELSAGLAEVIKHGLLADPVLFQWLEANMERLVRRDPEALTHVITRSAEIKAAIVVRDERESGPRMLLNLGHTFGHAIESGLGYGSWLHGEAVGAGLVLAADLSSRLGHLTAADVERVRDLVRRAGLPACAPALGVERYLELMSVDKKSHGGRQRFILLSSLGAAFVAEDVPMAAVRATLDAGTGEPAVLPG
jgi:shikimate kinase/3-dehydroquinate synthase